MKLALCIEIKTPSRGEKNWRASRPNDECVVRLMDTKDIMEYLRGFNGSAAKTITKAWMQIHVLMELDTVSAIHLIYRCFESVKYVPATVQFFRAFSDVYQ